jgi:hypothetical protein
MNKVEQRALYLLGKVTSSLEYDNIQNYQFKKAIEALWGSLRQALDFINENYGEMPVLVGGLAVQLYGVTRMTEDVDILVSKETYDKLVADEKIKYGQLKLIPGTQIDVLCEGKDENPHPDFVRGDPPEYPSLPGLIYLKLLSGRYKDLGDVEELLLVNYTPELHQQVMGLLPEDLQQAFLDLLG